MKKGSSAVAQQSVNISQQKLTTGLDLGDRNSWYCVVDEAGQIQREQRVRMRCGFRESCGFVPTSRRKRPTPSNERKRSGTVRRGKSL